MKRVALILMAVICLAITTTCFAETTSGATFNSPNGEVDAESIASFNQQTQYIDHSHTYSVPETDRNDPYGAGVDVIVWENQKKTVALEVQGKYDHPNKETSGFLVAKFNLWEMLSKKEDSK